MAKFDYEVPVELMEKFENLDANYDAIFGEMVSEGARVAHSLILANLHKSFKSVDSLLQGLTETRVYKTPSDDGINVHVGFYGYNDEGVPIPLIALAREYGTSSGEAKKPFLRRSFRKSEIEGAMRKVEERYIKGD